MANRLEVRLDPERRSRLEELAREKGAPISEVVRQLIDGAYEEIDRARRRRAVEEMKSMSLPVPEDPQDIRRIIRQSGNIGPLY